MDADGRERPDIGEVGGFDAGESLLRKRGSQTRCNFGLPVTLASKMGVAKRGLVQAVGHTLEE